MKTTPSVIALLIVAILGVTWWVVQLTTSSTPSAAEESAANEAQPEDTAANSTTTAVSNGTTTALLTESTWEWVETTMNDGTTITPNSSAAFTVDFSPLGRINGTTDCNSFRGQYELTGTALDVGPLATTKMLCPDAQESEFLNMITEANSIYFTANGQLVLLLPFDSGSVIFRPLND